jgi:iron complex outermembrane receptor protein
MKKSLPALLSILLLGPAFCLAQPIAAKIAGVVSDSTGSPVSYASVLLKPGNKGTTTNSDGHFSISDVAAGSYKIEVSAVGYQTGSASVSVSKAIVNNVSVLLKTMPLLLNEIIVTSRRGDERKENLTSSVTSISPQTVTELQTVSSNPADILAMSVPGLAVSTGSSSNWGQTLRGRQILVLIDGIPQSTPLRNGSMDIRVIDPYAIERIEVIKGATSIYGNGAAGGIINYITKQNNGKRKFSSKTELASTGSVVNPEGSLGARMYQSFSGRTGRLDYSASGSFEETGEMKDAEGDIVGPVYGLSNNRIYNAFAKVGYSFSGHQRLQLSYNYYGSREKNNLVGQTGSIAEGRKTISVPGTPPGSPPGTRWNHNGLLKYTHDKFFAKQNLNVTAYVQDISTVFFYSDHFEGGGQSTIQSGKKGVRFDLNAPFSVGQSVDGNVSYGFDYLQDVTSQPLLDGRSWVPEMNMTSKAPFLQLQLKVLGDIVYNGGLRFENINIGVEDYNTLKPYNAKTKTFGESMAVKGGDLNYNNLVFNSGLRYNRFGLFQPFVNFSQGFSVADLGLVLRAARVTDISMIQTEAVIVNNYEAGFASENNVFRIEASAYISQSDLGSSFQEVNGFYTTIRLPERVHGVEVAADVVLSKQLNAGVTYSYVEGKRDVNKNSSFDDAEDSYLGGERIAPPKYTTYLKYTPVQNLRFRLDYVGSGSRNRFQRVDGRYKTYEGEVKPYHIVNFSSSFRFSPAATVKLGVENLLNADYFPTRAQWLMFDQFYTKGRGTSFTLGITVDL